MGALALFCAATVVFLAARDLTVPHVRDVEVWGGFEVHGPAAWLSAPLHWAIFALGAWGFWRVRPWVLPAAAAYAFYVAASHLVWSEASSHGRGWPVGLAQAALFSLPGFALWRAHRRRRARPAVATGFDPEPILEFWFGPAIHDPAEADARESFWFGASAEADAEIRERFAGAVAAAARGELDTWLEQPRGAMALVVLLDQFPRNLGRGSARAFEHDAKALAAARSAIARGHPARLSPVEHAFLLLPLQHSEERQHQRESVRRSEQLARTAPAEWRPFLEHCLDFARQHLALVERFGRFPYRNPLLGRESTDAEREYLARGGATFGQGG
jgi:uncharacterized protein (DUF924 family)